MPTTEENIQTLINYLDQEQFTDGSLKDLQDCMKDSLVIVKAVNDQCVDMQNQINNLDVRVTQLE